MIASLLCGLTRLVSGLHVRWVGCQPENKQRIFFANHTSHLDFLALWSALPKDIRKQTRPVAAQDYWDQGIVRRYIAQHVIQAVLIARGRAGGKNREDHPLNKMLLALDQKYSLIIFPEGTRGRGDVIKPFKSGLYHLTLKRPGVELIPVYLDNLSRILPKGEFIAIPLLGSATFGLPVQLTEGETKGEFLNRARLAIEGLKPS